MIDLQTKLTLNKYALRPMNSKKEPHVVFQDSGTMLFMLFLSMWYVSNILLKIKIQN